MKKLVFLMMMGMTSLVWGSEEMTVQVISAVYEKSITPAFDAKLKKSALEVHKKIEAGRYVVTLGTYHDEKQAEQALKKARLVVAKDAFIRPVNRHPAEMAQTKAVQAVAHSEAAQTKITQQATHTEAKADTVAATVIESPKSEKSNTPIVTEAVKKPVSAAVTTLSECDKKEMRMDALAEAIRYYKTSPYHRFEPVVLRQ